MFAFAPYVLCPQVLQVGRDECRHEATGLRHRMVASFPFFSLRSCRRQVLKRIYLQSLNRRKVCLLRGGVKVSFVLADALSLVRRFPSDLYCDFSRSRLCAVADRRGQNNEEKKLNTREYILRRDVRSEEDFESAGNCTSRCVRLE